MLTLLAFISIGNSEEALEGKVLLKMWKNGLSSSYPSGGLYFESRFLRNKSRSETAIISYPFRA